MAFVPMESDPISNVQWIDAQGLNANLWNPNVVMNQELALLEFSIMKNGWIQPILINGNGVIIDGFHRWSLAVRSSRIMGRYNGKIPAVVMPIDDADAMLLTIRINRAKGSHLAHRMAEIVKKLIDVHGLDPQQIASEIGAHKGEVELLYQDSIFKARDIQNHEYSKAWVPKTS